MSIVLDERSTAGKILVSVRTLQRMRVEGTGPKFLKIGRLIRYFEHDVDAWLDSRRRQSTSQAA